MKQEPSDRSADEQIDEVLEILNEDPNSTAAKIRFVEQNIQYLEQRMINTELSMEIPAFSYFADLNNIQNFKKDIAINFRGPAKKNIGKIEEERKCSIVSILEKNQYMYAAEVVKNMMSGRKLYSHKSLEEAMDQIKLCIGKKDIKSIKDGKRRSVIEEIEQAKANVRGTAEKIFDNYKWILDCVDKEAYEDFISGLKTYYQRYDNEYNALYKQIEERGKKEQGKKFGVWNSIIMNKCKKRRDKVVVYRDQLKAIEENIAYIEDLLQRSIPYDDLKNYLYSEHIILNLDAKKDVIELMKINFENELKKNKLNIKQLDPQDKMIIISKPEGITKKRFSPYGFSKDSLKVFITTDKPYNLYINPEYADLLYLQYIAYVDLGLNDLRFMKDL